MTPIEYEIRARVDRVAHRLLGGHVLQRPDHGAHLRERRRDALGAGGRQGLDLGDAEIEHLHEVRIAVVLDEHDVLGLQVAMNDALRVGRPHAGHDAAHDPRGAVGLEGARREFVAQAAAPHELEDQEERPVRQPPEVRCRGDVGVVDAPGRPRLALEPRDDLGPVEQARCRTLSAKAFRMCWCSTR